MAEKKQKPRYVTENVFEQSMRSIALAFGSVHDRLDKHDRMFEILIVDVKGIREEMKEMRADWHDGMMWLHKHERRINDHTERIEHLEEKIA